MNVIMVSGLSRHGQQNPQEFSGIYLVHSPLSTSQMNILLECTDFFCTCYACLIMQIRKIKYIEFSKYKFYAKK